MAARRRARRSRRSKQPPANDGSFEEQTRWLPILVFAISLFVFLPALGNDFVNWDDDRNFLDNSSYRGLSFENLKWMFTTFHLGHYHPLTWLTLGLDYVLWGMNPSGYHLTNALLHAGTSWLVYLVIVQLLQLARREEGSTPALLFSAALGALLFAIHPLRVESVAWASERRDVLSGLFYVGSILLYLRGRLWTSVGVFGAALLSKVMVAGLPIILLVLDVYPLRRKFDLSLLWSKIPYFGLAMAAGVFALAQQRTGVAGTFEDIQVEPLLRLTLSLYGLAFYLGKTVFPFSLAPQYVYSTSPHAFDAPLIVGSVVAVAVTIASLLLRRRWPALAAAWACYVITLLPVLSILRFDPQQYVAEPPQLPGYNGLRGPRSGWILDPPGTAAHGSGGRLRGCGYPGAVRTDPSPNPSLGELGDTLDAHTEHQSFVLPGPQQPRTCTGRPRPDGQGVGTPAHGGRNPARLRPCPLQPRTIADGTGRAAKSRIPFSPSYRKRAAVRSGSSRLRQLPGSTEP